MFIRVWRVLLRRKKCITANTLRVFLRTGIGPGAVLIGLFTGMRQEHRFCWQAYIVANEYKQRISGHFCLME
jgi:hypothetical protein